MALSLKARAKVTDKALAKLEKGGLLVTILMLAMITFEAKEVVAAFFLDGFLAAKSSLVEKDVESRFLMTKNLMGLQGIFFEAHPELTKGRKIIKRHHPRCFGCILENADAKNCKFCGSEFRRPENKQRRSASPATSVKSGEDKNNRNLSSTEQTIKKLVAKGMTEPEAIKFLKEEFGIVYKAPKPKPKANEVI